MQRTVVWAGLMGLALAADGMAVDEVDISTDVALALGLDFEALEPLAVDDARIAAVGAATGLDATDLKAIRLFQTEADQKQVRIAVAPLADSGEARFVLLGLGADGRFAGTRSVVDEDFIALPEWKPFLGQIRRPPVLKGARPRSSIDAIDAKAEPEAAALVELTKAMLEQAALENSDAEPEVLQAAPAAWDRIVAAAEKLKPTLGADGAKLVEMAKNAAAAAKTLAKSAAEHDDAAFEANEVALEQTCKSCHRSFEDRLRDRRAELGYGNGVFAVGFDLEQRHRDRAAAQKVADAMRAASLLLAAP